MKIIRCIDRDGQTYHAVESADGGYVEVTGDIENGFVSTGRSVAPVKILYPLVPKSILGIGANYKALFKDKPLPEYPIVFFKCHNTLQNPGDPIVLPRLAIQAETVKFEGELAVIIGKGGKNIPVSSALDHVFGYTIADDVSASDWQQARVGNQWCKGKGFDTFCPLGPAMVTRNEIPNPESLRIVTKVNDVVEQDESVSEMCFSVPQLIAFLSAGHTLSPGDIILTGTPTGARFMQPGEVVSITIDPIGTLTNPVIEEE